MLDPASLETLTAPQSSWTAASGCCKSRLTASDRSSEDSEHTIIISLSADGVSSLGFRDKIITTYRVSQKKPHTVWRMISFEPFTVKLAFYTKMLGKIYVNGLNILC